MDNRRSLPPSGAASLGAFLATPTERRHSWQEDAQNTLRAYQQFPYSMRDASAWHETRRIDVQQLFNPPIDSALERAALLSTQPTHTAQVDCQELEERVAFPTGGLIYTAPSTSYDYVGRAASHNYKSQPASDADFYEPPPASNVYQLPRALNDNELFPRLNIYDVQPRWDDNEPRPLVRARGEPTAKFYYVKAPRPDVPTAPSVPNVYEPPQALNDNDLPPGLNVYEVQPPWDDNEPRPLLCARGERTDKLYYVKSPRPYVPTAPLVPNVWATASAPDVDGPPPASCSHETSATPYPYEAPPAPYVGEQSQAPYVGRPSTTSSSYDALLALYVHKAVSASYNDATPPAPNIYDTPPAPYAHDAPPVPYVQVSAPAPPNFHVIPPTPNVNVIPPTPDVNVNPSAPYNEVHQTAAHDTPMDRLDDPLYQDTLALGHTPLVNNEAFSGGRTPELLASAPATIPVALTRYEVLQLRQRQSAAATDDAVSSSSLTATPDKFQASNLGDERDVDARWDENARGSENAQEVQDAQGDEHVDHAIEDAEEQVVEEGESLRKVEIHSDLEEGEIHSDLKEGEIYSYLEEGEIRE